MQNLHFYELENCSKKELKTIRNFLQIPSPNEKISKKEQIERLAEPYFNYFLSKLNEFVKVDISGAKEISFTSLQTIAFLNEGLSYYKGVCEIEDHVNKKFWILIGLNHNCYDRFKSILFSLKSKKRYIMFENDHLLNDENLSEKFLSDMIDEFPKGKKNVKLKFLKMFENIAENKKKIVDDQDHHSIDHNQIKVSYETILNTLENLVSGKLRLVKNEGHTSFISQVKISIQKLLSLKNNFYINLIEDIEKQYDALSKKKIQLEKEGIKDRDFNELYPIFLSLSVRKMNITEIRNIIFDKLLNISSESIKTSFLEVIKILKEIVGLEEIKINIVSNLISLKSGPGFFFKSFNNLMILGPAGAGKTFIASIISKIYSLIGILATNNIKILSPRSDLVGKYIGHTAVLIQSHLFDTLEGIIFIDEAYQLAPSEKSSIDFGSEAITELINFMDKYIGMSIIIVAGYEEPMKTRFLAHNEGLARRFPNIFILRSYSSKELTIILIKFLHSKLESSIHLSKEIYEFLYTFINVANSSTELRNKLFKNSAGDILNLATCIVKNIYISDISIEWANDDYENNIQILQHGIDEFINQKI